MNPVLPFDHRVPDAEVRIFKNRCWFYGSYDSDLSINYCSKEYHVFSTDDLVSYTDHGLALHSSWTPEPEKILFAPDCVYRNGKYYLYWATNARTNFVAESDSPGGPFSNVQEIKLPDRQIDPAVLIDDDGKVYFYWGQFNCQCIELGDDMATPDLSTHSPRLLTEEEHGFHEGPSIRKINGTYYLVYSDIDRGRATCLSYATSQSPKGPFTKRGVIIDCVHADPESWNNHGSMFQFKNQWYISYHRSSNCREGQRRLCLEKITINPDGSIAEVPMTTQGPDDPLNPKTPLPAIHACELHGKVRINPFEKCLSQFENGSFAGFRYFSFNGETKTTVRCASVNSDCILQIRLNSKDGEILGSSTIPSTGGRINEGLTAFTPVTVPHRRLEGIHAIFIEAVCVKNRFFNVSEISFS